MLSANGVDSSARAHVEEVVPVQPAVMVKHEQLILRHFNVDDSSDDNEDGGYVYYKV